MEEARLRSLEKQLNDIELLVRQADGIIVDASDRAALSYGYPRDELLGRPVNGFGGPRTGGRVEVRLRVVARREKAAREKILAVVAHDLRNPLAAITATPTGWRRPWAGPRPGRT